MQLMADGLAGHEHDFYKYVAQSSWTGGNQEYSNLNEGYPYWFNGLVPLAYGLNDSRLKAQVQTAVSAVLSRQQSDGWIGPETGNARNFWARYPLFLGFIQVLEADNATYGATVLPAMNRFVTLMNSMLHNNGSGYLPQQGDLLSPDDHIWGRVRVCDMLVSLQWLYENAPANNSKILLDNMSMLREGQLDWADWYQEGVYISQDLSTVDVAITTKYFPYEHGVNVGQGLKAGAVINRFTNNASLPVMARRAVNWTNIYHGAASGTILADERLEGLGPYSASELCTTVETLYSLSYLYQALGDVSFADQAEKIAFNALPVHLMPDWWAHNYGTQPNGPYAVPLQDTPFWNMNDYSPTYGLEPDYPCCTVNHPQGYPKFLAASWAGVGHDGLAHVLLTPGAVTTNLGAGNAVHATCETNYPFDSTLQYGVNASAPFTFYVRVPSWASASSSSLTINDTSTSLAPDPHSGLHSISLGSGSTSFAITLSSGSSTPAITLQHRANDSVAVFAGPLLYSLSISSNTTTSPLLDFRQQPLPSGYAPPQVKDYAISNTSAWNIAIDTSTLAFHSNISSSAGPGYKLPNPIWAPGAPPTRITGKGCAIAWPIWKGVPGPVPPKSQRQCLGDVLDVVLVPYGSAKLHMSELPTVDLDLGT
jgi:Beta-L-arabinofuranosidase, GH127